MLTVLIIVVVAIAVLAAVGWRAYRPRDVNPDRGIRQTEPPADRDRTWDPAERYSEGRHH